MNELKGRKKKCISLHITNEWPLSFPLAAASPPRRLYIALSRSRVSTPSVRHLVNVPWKVISVTIKRSRRCAPRFSLSASRVDALSFGAGGQHQSPLRPARPSGPPWQPVPAPGLLRNNRFILVFSTSRPTYKLFSINLFSFFFPSIKIVWLPEYRKRKASIVERVRGYAQQFP